MRALAGVAAVLLVGGASSAEAQSEEAMRRFFEGKSVIVKFEMPGTEDGVDVYPGTSQPIDFPRHARRLKQYGTAIRRGEEMLITKVKLKKDLIEFHLGGGGYGTFGDETSSHVSTPSVGKSTRERNLEKEIPAITDAVAKKKAQEELDGLRRSRERADARNRAEVAEAQEIRAANIRQRRLEGGSRFNVRYQTVVPVDAMTPDGVMRALAEYVDFGAILAAAADRPGVYGEGRGPAASGELRKGLLVEEVDAILGRPDTISQRSEGIFKVSSSVYLTRDRRVEAEFVEGVLIRFTMSSR